MAWPLTSFEEVSRKLHKLAELPESRAGFFKNFPFNQLVNFSTMDTVILSHCFNIVDFVTEYDEFYCERSPFAYCLDFILLTLSNTNGDQKSICDFLDLLRKIITRVHSLAPGCYNSFYDEARLLVVLVDVTNTECFDKVLAKHCNDMLIELFSINDKWWTIQSTCATVTAVFSKFKQIQAVSEMCTLSQHVLDIYIGNKWQLDYPLKLESLLKWVAQESCMSFVDNQMDDGHEANHAILVCIISYCRILGTNDDLNFRRILMSRSNKICQFICGLQNLRDDSQSVLSFLLDRFCCDEYTHIINLHYSDLKIEVWKLSLDIDAWWSDSPYLYLIICHMLVKYSILIWDEEVMLKNLIHILYKNNQNLPVYVLKAMTFLYPTLMTSLPSTDLLTFIAGKDLLFRLIKLRNIPYIYSHTKEQLQWILQRGTNPLKKDAIRHWLIKNQSENVLIESIKLCKIEHILIDLLLVEFQNELGEKILSLIRRVNSAELSQQIGLALPLVTGKRDVFNCLLLCEPGVPTNTNDSLLICAMMGAIIPSLNDRSVLKGACCFSRRLLISVNTAEAVKQFCLKIDNLSYLINYHDSLDDSTVTEIIKLLTIIVQMQSNFSIALPTITINDLSTKLTNRFELNRIGEWLQFLVYICNDEVFIRLNDTCLLGLHQKAIEFSFEPELRRVSYMCLLVLWRKQSWLTLSPYSNHFIEENCSTLADLPYTKYFLKLLHLWIKYIWLQPDNGFCYIPSIAIASFLLRVPHSKETIEKDRVKYYLDLLKKFESRQLKLY